MPHSCCMLPQVNDDGTGRESYEVRIMRSYCWEQKDRGEQGEQGGQGAGSSWHGQWSDGTLVGKRGVSTYLIACKGREGDSPIRDSLETTPSVVSRIPSGAALVEPTSSSCLISMSFFEADYG